MRRRFMVNFDIKLGFKEIVALAVSIPTVYSRIRKLKLKFDEKELEALKEYDSYIFNGAIIGPDGSVWRREK